MKSTLAPDYIVGTDGLCKNNQAAGGQKGTWAFMVMSNLTKEIKGGKSGSNPSTTNNIMEMTAVLEAMKWSVRNNVKIELLTDSQYVYNGLTKWAEGWQKRNWKKADNSPVLNKELWQEMLEVYDPKIHWLNWTRGHQTDSSYQTRINNAADSRCNEEYINSFT